MINMVKTLLFLTILVTMAACTKAPLPAAQSPILETLEDNGYFLTIAAIEAAGGLSIYGDVSSKPITIFSPTQTGWNATADSLGYPSAEAMINGLPKETLRSLLLFNCLPHPEFASKIGTFPTRPTCLVQGGQPVEMNVHTVNTIVGSEGPAATAFDIEIRDAACTTILLRHPDFVGAESVIHGTDRLAIGPNILTVPRMLESNPITANQKVAFGAQMTQFLSEVASLSDPYTVFIPTIEGFAEDVSNVGPSGFGFTQEQILNFLRYQVTTTKLEIDTVGTIATLAGREILINAEGIPAHQSTVTAEEVSLGERSIIQKDSLGVDGNNIYCIDKMLFPQYPPCVAKTDANSSKAACANATINEFECNSVTVSNYSGTPSVSVCSYVAPSCNVHLENQIRNCQIYEDADPVNGTECNLHSDFCTWDMPTTSCVPIGGGGADAIACASIIDGSEDQDDICNSINDPEFSMCEYIAPTCFPNTSAIEGICSQLNNSDCISTSAPAPNNSDFCAPEVI